MEKEMGNNRINKEVYICSDNIISSLGFTTKENVDNIRDYKSGIKRIEDKNLLSSSFMGGQIDENSLSILVKENKLENYKKSEQLVILSILDTIKDINISLADKRTALIISTTKGDIQDLECSQDNLPFLWKLSENVSSYFGMTSKAQVISNACISGISATIVASRLIETGDFDNVIVAGVDVLSEFIVSGFNSFKSLSQEICRPYDSARDGLNIGEACGSILLSSNIEILDDKDKIQVFGGGISNDANHISGPSRDGGGLASAIKTALELSNLESEDIDFVNCHGTATVYNDEMESKALALMNLSDKALNSLKPYFGHTLGASGVIEIIACIHQLRENIVFGVKGFQELGVSCDLSLSDKHRDLPINTCLKTASGFGGCNAALIFGSPNTKFALREEKKCTYSLIKECNIEDKKLFVDGQLLFNGEETETYKEFISLSYKLIGKPDIKYFKADEMSKLGTTAANHLLKDILNDYKAEEISLLMANSSASLNTDIKHQKQINSEDEVSPAIFVYTLPNIVMGEICIKHGIKGENTFFVAKEMPNELFDSYLNILFNRGIKLCILGWCDFLNDEYKLNFKLIKRD
jgi:3-oxoacyl-(acyl-carrier-protein) synthase